MANWLLGERRGAAWKRGWTGQTLASMSAPPLPLLAIFFIIFLLLSLPSYVNYKNQMRITVINFKLFLVFLPPLMVLLAPMVYQWGMFILPGTKARYHGSGERSSSPSAWDVPWGMVFWVVLLLGMAFYRPSY